MENREYLNEEKYQKTVKKLKILSLVILIVGLLLGLSLIITGIVKVKTDKSILVNDIETSVLGSVNKEEAKKEIEEARKELKTVENDLKKLKDELSEIEAKENDFIKNMSANTDSNKLTEIINEKIQKTLEVNNKNLDKAKLEATINTLTKQLEELDRRGTVTKIFSLTERRATDTYKVAKYSFYFISGSFIIFTTLMISGFIYFLAKRREISAFTTQQQMPIIKETAEELAPTAGIVSEEIAKGVKEGLKDEENE